MKGLGIALVAAAIALALAKAVFWFLDWFFEEDGLTWVVIAIAGAVAGLLVLGMWSFF